MWQWYRCNEGSHEVARLKICSDLDLRCRLSPFWSKQSAVKRRITSSFVNFVVYREQFGLSTEPMSNFQFQTNYLDSCLIVYNHKIWTWKFILSKRWTTEQYLCIICPITCILRHSPLKALLLPHFLVLLTDLISPTIYQIIDCWESYHMSSSITSHQEDSRKCYLEFCRHDTNLIKYIQSEVSERIRSNSNSVTCISVAWNIS